MISLVTLIARLEQLAQSHGGGTPVAIAGVEWSDGIVRIQPEPEERPTSAAPDEQ
jgi:hypothetical protein